MFQPTRPRGARPCCSRACTSCEGSFNPRARAGRDPYAALNAICHALFQPTRPRGARHLYRRVLNGQSIVSTHAPARGATSNVVNLFPRTKVSTHAPARGATTSPRMDRSINHMFQPTRPRGARRNVTITGSSPTVFQPTRPRGARRSDRCLCSASRCFNPRARAGRDAENPPVMACQFVFQPTRPRGARPAKFTCACARTGSFNPRARAGRDLGNEYASIFLNVSTHAPARGATSEATSNAPPDLVSTHAPARGATFVRKLVATIHTFQPTRPRGARQPIARLAVTDT